jgi:Anti-sigma-K factor rskA
VSTREGEVNYCSESVDAAPYVLGALADAELYSYREHLGICASCRAVLAELQVVVNELPASAPPVVASAALRGRILATVRSEAELLRAAGHEADEPRRSVSRWRSRQLSFATAGVALIAVAAAAIAIAVGGGSSVGGRVIPGKVQASVRGARAFLRQRGDAAELVVSRMPQPALGRIYEVWLSRGPGQAQPTNALFSVTSRGSGSVDVPDNLHGVKEVMVTSEPLGGSSHPTSPPLMRILLHA